MKIIDVREPHEYANSHVNGAINIPLDQLRISEKLNSLSKDEEVIVYCNSGNRSGVAQNILESLGFNKITNGINQMYTEDIRENT